MRAAVVGDQLGHQFAVVGGGAGREEKVVGERVPAKDLAGFDHHDGGVASGAQRGDQGAQGTGPVEENPVVLGWRRWVVAEWAKRRGTPGFAVQSGGPGRGQVLGRR